MVTHLGSNIIFFKAFGENLNEGNCVSVSQWEEHHWINGVCGFGSFLIIEHYEISVSVLSAYQKSELEFCRSMESLEPRTSLVRSSQTEEFEFCCCLSMN